MPRKKIRDEEARARKDGKHKRNASNLAKRLKMIQRNVELLRKYQNNNDQV